VKFKERPANAIAPMFAKAYPTIQTGANQKIGYRQLEDAHEIL
jgi:hypothetical protein